LQCVACCSVLHVAVYCMLQCVAGCSVLQVAGCSVLQVAGCSVLHVAVCCMLHCVACCSVTWFVTYSKDTTRNDGLHGSFTKDSFVTTKNSGSRRATTQSTLLSQDSWPIHELFTNDSFHESLVRDKNRVLRVDVRPCSQHTLVTKCMSRSRMTHEWLIHEWLIHKWLVCDKNRVMGVDGWLYKQHCSHRIHDSFTNDHAWPRMTLCTNDLFVTKKGYLELTGDHAGNM